MYDHLKTGNQVGITIAKCINHAFDGDIEEAANELANAVTELVKIKSEATRQRATHYAVEVARAWLDLDDGLYPVIEGTRAVEPFWRPRVPKVVTLDEQVSLYSAGVALAKALSYACNGKPLEAKATFPLAIAQLNQLPTTGDRFDACDYALQIADRGWEAVAVQAWQDLIDATEHANEIYADLAFSHMVVAVEDLAAIVDPQERAMAVEFARQRVIAVQGNKFQEAAPFFVQIFGQQEGWNATQKAVFSALVQPKEVTPARLPG